MIRLILYILVSMVFHACTTFKHTVDENSPFSPFHIVSAESHFVKRTYVVVGMTKSYPAKPIKKEDGYLYDIHFSIIFKEPRAYWNQPFYLQLDYPDGSSEDLEFNADGGVLAGEVIHDFTFKKEVKHLGEMRLTVGYETPDGKMVFDKYNPFKSKLVSLK